MHPLASHYRTLALNNLWSNHRLFGAVTKLGDDALAAPRTSFFPSLVHTLNHLLTVDWFYVDALERALAGQPPHERPSTFFEPEIPVSGAARLREEQTKVDRRLLALCEGLDGPALEVTVGIQRAAGLATDPVSHILVHLFTHQIHHRGQVHAMLAGTDVTPPQLDELFCASDAAARAEDLRELGLTEADLWR